MLSSDGLSVSMANGEFYELTGLNFGNHISAECCSKMTDTFMPSFTFSTGQPITFVIIRGPSSKSIQAMT